MRLNRQISSLAIAALIGVAGLSGLALPSAYAQTAQAVPIRPNPARVQQKMREIEPEYRRRVLRDGKAVADAWLVRTARQWGIEEGRRARREYDANQRRAAEAQNRPRLARPPVSSPSASPSKPAPVDPPLPAAIREGLR